MLNIGAGEMMLILVVALLVLGPTRLPELARGIGKFMKEFRKQTSDVRSMVEREFYQIDQEVRQIETDFNSQQPVAKTEMLPGPPPPAQPTPGWTAPKAEPVDPWVLETSQPDATTQSEPSAPDEPTVVTEVAKRS
jgi:sec-independent protein translocase protein TatB